MKVRVGAIKEKIRIKPVKEGVTGMYLTKMLEVKTNKNGNQLVAEFTHKESSRVFDLQQFDPFTPSEKLSENQIDANFLRIFRFAKAYMTESAYIAFEAMEFDDDLQGMVDYIVNNVDPLWPDVEATLMVGYSKFSGYLSIPDYEPWISTRFDEKELEFPAGSLSLTPVENPGRAAAAGKDGAKPDKEKKSAADEV